MFVASVNDFFVEEGWVCGLEYSDVKDLLKDPIGFGQLPLRL